MGSISGSGRSSGVGGGNPPPYSCLENFMDRGAWQATEATKSQTRLSTTATDREAGLKDSLEGIVREGNSSWHFLLLSFPIFILMMNIFLGKLKTFYQYNLGTFIVSNSLLGMRGRKIMPNRDSFFSRHKKSRVLIIGSVAEGCYGYDSNFCGFVFIFLTLLFVYFHLRKPKLSQNYLHLHPT